MLDAEQAIAEVLTTATNPCITSSFQADCMALVHMVTRFRPHIPVLFLDTGYHFPETYEYRDQMVSRLGLNLINLQPAQSVAEQESQFGILHQTSPDRCCHLRKVVPLFEGLSPYDTWFTALRRDQSPTRANLKIRDQFPLQGGKIIEKVSPLAYWSMRDVWYYLKANDIPALPLYDQGYSSIGCAPCTSLPVLTDQPRSGRWGGQKLECGIHIASNA